MKRFCPVFPKKTKRQPKAQTSQLKPLNPPLGTLSLNMIHIKKFGKTIKDKCLGEKPKMNWNEFGENEWQVVEQSMKDQTLPPVRYEDLFLRGDNPKGKNYKQTKWGDLVTITQISQNFDVFNPDWINIAHHKKYEYISHGLFQCRIQGLHSPNPDAKICAILVDKRTQEFKKSIIGIGQLEFDQSVAYFNVISGFVLPLRPSKFIKLIIGTQGYEKYIIHEGILSVQHQSRVTFTNFARDGLLNHLQRQRMNEEILVRTSRGMADYNFKKVRT